MEDDITPASLQGQNMISSNEISSNSESVLKMKRTMGLFTGVMVTSGVMIGSGIFVAPKGVILQVGSVGMALIVWVMCGVISLFGAHSYAELGTLITKSGGSYTYIKESLGDLPSFIYIWGALLVMLPGTKAAIAITFANYVMYPFFPDCDIPVIANRLLAAVALGNQTGSNQKLK